MIKYIFGNNCLNVYFPRFASTTPYIRVSSTDQNIDRQLEEMLSLGINERDIYIDKQSGKDFERTLKGLNIRPSKQY